jgi:hypothetical protein
MPGTVLSPRRLDVALVPVLAAACLLLTPAPGAGAPVPVGDPIRIDLAYDPTAIRIERGAGGVRWTAPGLVDPGPRSGNGAFALVLVALPDGATASGVLAVGQDPAPVARLDSGDMARLAVRPAAPGEPIDVSFAVGSMRGVRLLVARVSPFQLDPASGELRLFRRLELHVDTAPASGFEGDLVIARPDSPGDLRFRRGLRALVANPEAIPEAAGAPAPDRTRPAGRTDLVPRAFVEPAWSPRFRPSLDGRPVDMVIVTGAGLVAEYERLAEWRTKSGLYTVIRTVEDIAAAYPEGVDLQERIRRFIRDAVSLWGVEWVLLGGDADIIPVRYGRTLYYGGEDIPADNYYQCLDRTWNENGNAHFAEGAPPGNGSIPADNADLIPDVWLSRIPCSTVEGTRNMIDKTLGYERTPSLDPGYLDRILAFGEVLQPANWNFPDTVVFDGAILCEEAIADLAPHFTPVRLYENYQAYQGVGALPETKEAVLAHLSAGAAIAYHAGHGFHNNLSVGIGGNELFRDDVDDLQNVGKPFLFFGINCNSAAIDFDSIAEHFLCQPNGAFAYLGSTRFDFPGTEDLYQRVFLQRMLAGRRLGEAHALAKLAEVPLAISDGPERWHQLSIVSFGDPAVRLYSGPPAVLSVTHPTTVTAGEPVPVTVQKAGSPLSGARVTIYRAGHFFASDTTDANGQVDLPCPADAAGSFSLVVTAVHALPYEAESSVVLPPGAWPVVTGLTIDDDESGNGNGRLEAGETVDLHLRVRNDGDGPADGLSATLVGAHPGLMIVQPTGTLGSLGAGATDSTWEGAALRVSLAMDAPEWQDLPVTIDFAWSGGVRSLPVGLRAGGVDLFVALQQFVDDPGGAGQDSVPAPGEVIALTPTLANRGGGMAVDARARLETTDPRVTLGSAEVVLGNLAAGASAPLPAPLTFSVTELAAVPQIDLVLEVSGVEVGRRAVDLTPPAPPPAPRGLSRPSSILLTWDPVVLPDLRGFRIERADAPEGPFTVINAIVDNPMAFYEDIGLAPFGRYYYRVAAMDRSGNLSGYSPVVGLSASFPAINNWPVRREGVTPSSPVVHDFDGDGVLEIVIGGEEIYAVRADGTEYRNGDADSRTLGILTRTDRALYWATPAVADIDADGVLEIVCAGWNDGNLYVFESDGVVAPGWPRPIGNRVNTNGAAYPWGSPMLTDVDGDGDREIFIFGDRYLHAFHHDGTELKDGDGNPATIGPWVVVPSPFNYGTPAAADFDGDGRPEVAFGTRSGQIFLVDGDGTTFAGFPKSYPSGQITGSPAIADLDKDGELEIIFPVRQLLEVHAVNRHGASPPGWPARIQINQDFDASPTVADLDGDGFPDVVMSGGTGRVSAWKGQSAALLPGFPVDLALLEPSQSFALRGTPCLGDVTGDGHPDIIVGTQTGSVYGIGSDGSILPGFPLRAEDNIEGGALLWDIDGDGYTNIVFGSVDKRVYAYDTPGIFNETSCPWPMFRRDQSNTGYVGNPLSVPVAPTLAAFAASWTSEGVRLTWRAASGDFVGWLVDRAPAEAPDESVRLTPAPLSASTAPEFVDGSAAAGGRYLYRVTGLTRAGLETVFQPLAFEVPGGAPPALRLRNAPNPFAGGTTLFYEVPGAGSRPVQLDIFDAQGRLVRRLLAESQHPGPHAIAWDGRDAAGRPVEAGLYLYRLTAGSDTITQKMTLIR